MTRRRSPSRRSAPLDVGTTYTVTSHDRRALRGGGRDDLARTRGRSRRSRRARRPSRRRPRWTARSGSAAYTNVTATFDQAMSASTIDTSSFKLLAPGGAAVAATVSLRPGHAHGDAHPGFGPDAEHDLHRRAERGGERRGSRARPDESWTFTTSDCPCSLFGDAPLNMSHSGLSTANGRSGGPVVTRDGRQGPGRAARAHRSRCASTRTRTRPAPTPAHVWTASGTLLATVDFEDETASGLADGRRSPRR